MEPRPYEAVSPILELPTQQNHLGIGTIVGSAVFNVLVITGVSAVIVTVQVDLAAVLRDIVAYVACIALLFVVIYDGRITAAEALLLTGAYAAYVGILLRWPKRRRYAAETAASVEPDASARRERPGPYIRVTSGVSRLIGLLARREGQGGDSPL